MAKLRAKNDWLIDKLIEDPQFDVRPDGTIWTIRALNGRPCTVWRVAGKTDKEGYREIRYRGKWLKAHRIVYRKYRGELSPTLVVDHGDCQKANNHPDNLSLVTPQLNTEYCYRRREIARASKKSLQVAR